MTKSFNYTLSQLKLDATTFCNMKPSCFYYIFLNHYQKGLDEKLLNTVSLEKDVLNSIENVCDTLLVKDVLVSLFAKYFNCNRIVHIVVRINIYFLVLLHGASSLCCFNQL